MAMNRIHTSKFPITFIVGWNTFAWHGQLRCDAKRLIFFSAGLARYKLTDIHSWTYSNLLLNLILIKKVDGTLSIDSLYLKLYFLRYNLNLP